MSNQMWPSYWAWGVLFVVPFLYGCFAHGAEFLFEAQGGWLSQFSYESIGSPRRIRMGVMGGLIGLTFGLIFGMVLAASLQRAGLELFVYMALLGSIGSLAGSLTFWLGGDQAFMFTALGPTAGAAGSMINGTNVFIGGATGLVLACISGIVIFAVAIYRAEKRAMDRLDKNAETGGTRSSHEQTVHNAVNKVSATVIQLEDHEDKRKDSATEQLTATGKVIYLADRAKRRSPPSAPRRPHNWYE